MTATLNGKTITSAKIQLPRRGVWWADVEVDEPDELSGAATIVVGETTFVGTIMSGGALYGRGRWRVAGGAGRWGVTLPARGYSNDAGVKVQTLLADAARECGESLELTTADRVGAHWSRASSNASRVFDDLGLTWRVDTDGVTRLGLRAAATYAGDGVVSVVDSETVRVATDDPAGLAPGVVVGDVAAADVEIEVSPTSILVWCRADASSATKGVADALGRLVTRSLPDLRAFAPWEYRVVSQTGERLTLQPAASRYGLPDLSDVFVRPGAPGGRAKWALGSLCVVQFVNGSFARPIVSHADAPDSPGWLPTELHFEAANQHVKLVNSATEIGDKLALKAFVALADKVNRNFTFWQNLLTNWMPAPNDGGAALKTAFGIAVANPLINPVDVSAQHVKAN